ncbi:MAG TPA: bifunctional indole-3-glycerol-phosphate synthase TrpC/phosphoribosylanthranilate isomerase TrpF [Ktedonobacteraceae bacterium]|nr:bifunctional indole-3-glycerol-phosphate synthase TrpC/phosphoribosylanthranilate isomerase TrpF [Ktedonobacteraceae bacterium]
MFLDRIVTQTRLDLEQRKREKPIEEIQRLAAAQPEPRNLLAALRSGKSQVRLIAEVKRASPSKGLLAPELDPLKLARIYEANGAAAISVLTEPHFFLGSSEYLTAIKQTVSIPVLRKDFIVEEYQVYEARAWGADAILLICAILDDTQLHHLLKVADEQHMHCLVEVHSVEEAQRAVTAGARIIGVNSRDLATFQMNPYLMRELRQLIPTDRVVVAESGIHSAADARRLARYDVQAMLVGESLVVSNDIPTQMRSLLQGANASVQVKICGLRTHEHLQAAIGAGADMLGFIFYAPSHRYIQPQQVQVLLEHTGFTVKDEQQLLPDLVGVFVNENADFINEVAEQVGLHFVQLHSHEAPEFCSSIKRPVIKALQLHSDKDREMVKAYREVAWRILLDTPTSIWGGTGVTHDWQLARSVAQQTPILLAGGLTPENVGEAISQVHPWGVDVSSGVETNRSKDVEKIRAFIENVRKVEPTTWHPQAQHG